MVHHDGIGAFAQENETFQPVGKGLQNPGNSKPEGDAGDRSEVRDDRTVHEAGAPHSAVSQAAAVQDNS